LNRLNNTKHTVTDHIKNPLWQIIKQRISYEQIIIQRITGVWCLTPFNNISVISLRSDLLVEETRVPEENHRPAASHWNALSHI